MGKKPSANDKLDTEDLVVARKKELKSMDAAALKSLVISKNLDVGNKDANVDAVLAAEAQERIAAAEKAKEYEKVATKLKDDLAAKGNQALKHLCREKGLKVGGGKDDKVERLFEYAKETGAVDRAIIEMEKERRKEELAGMDKDALFALRKKLGADPVYKEVMIDHIITREYQK